MPSKCRCRHRHTCRTVSPSPSPSPHRHTPHATRHAAATPATRTPIALLCARLLTITGKAMVHPTDPTCEVVDASSPSGPLSVSVRERSIEIAPTESFSKLNLSDVDAHAQEEDDLVIGTCVHQSRQQKVTFPTGDASRLKKFERLAEIYPTATNSEVIRFLHEHKTVSSAQKKLGAYLAWREQARKAVRAATDDDRSDEKISDDGKVWECCCRAAAGLLALNVPRDFKLTRIIRVLENSTYPDVDTTISDVDGNGVLLLLPAILDTKLGSVSTYAVATALYIERILDRADMNKMTLVVDVRPGKGWQNPTPQHVLPYLQKISQLGADFFPERLARAVAVPVPVVAVGLWNIAKPMLDKKHASRVCLVSGSANGKSPLPTKQMTEYFPLTVVQYMERNRRDSFIDKTPTKA